jgi:hypothetical protein
MRILGGARGMRAQQLTARLRMPLGQMHRDDRIAGRGADRAGGMRIGLIHRRIDGRGETGGQIGADMPPAEKPMAATRLG